MSVLLCFYSWSNIESKEHINKSSRYIKLRGIANKKKENRKEFNLIKPVGIKWEDEIQFME